MTVKVKKKWWLDKGTLPQTDVENQNKWMDVAQITWCAESPLCQWRVISSQIPCSGLDALGVVHGECIEVLMLPLEFCNVREKVSLNDLA